MFNFFIYFLNKLATFLLPYSIRQLAKNLCKELVSKLMERLDKLEVSSL